MKNKKHFLKTDKLGLALAAVLLAALTEGAGNAGAQNVVVTAPAPVVVVTAPAVIPDSYVYYPNYGVYYNSHGHQYYYLQNNAWVMQPQPFGVTAEVLLASPSVNMDFHDSPSRHHDEMLKRYPHDWHPPAGHQDRQDHPQHQEHHEAPKAGVPDDHKR